MFSYAFRNEHGGWLYREPAARIDKTDGPFQATKRMAMSAKSSLFDNSDRWDVSRSKVVKAFDEGFFSKVFGIRLDKFYKYKYSTEEGGVVADRRNDHR